MNNFQRLQQEVETQHPPPPELREHIVDELRMLQFFGQALDLYLPRVLEAFVVWLGGTPDRLGGEEPPDFGHLRGGADPDLDRAPGRAHPHDENE